MVLIAQNLAMGSIGARRNTLPGNPQRSGQASWAEELQLLSDNSILRFAFSHFRDSTDADLG
jgi:hypothetical protein